MARPDVTVVPFDADNASAPRAIAALQARFAGAELVSAVPVPAQAGVKLVQETLPYVDYLAVWREAYRMTDRLLAGRSDALRAVLEPFYHPIADLALRILLVGEACRRAGGHTVVLAPLARARHYARLPVNVASDASSYFFCRSPGMRRLGRAGLDALRGRRARRQAMPANDTPTAKPGPRIAIAVDDSVSAVNYGSSRAIADALRARGVEPVIVTTHSGLRDQFANASYDVLFAAAPSLGLLRHGLVSRWFAGRRELAAMRRAAKLSWEERMLIVLVGEKLPAYAGFALNVELMLNANQLGAGMQASLAVNEGTPVAVATLHWSRRRGVPNVGYWPALLGDRPDCEYFPAERHLVYGDQLRDKMIGLGFDAGTVETVGSCNFDKALTRDRDADRAYVRSNLLHGREPRESLAVVATEALPRPFEELEPVLAALSAMDDVEIVVKLHPADSAEFYGAELRSRGYADRVVLVGRCDVDALLHAADLLVCVLSNIIVNAALLGTPTAVCDFGNKRAPLDFVAEGLATGCFEPGAVAPTLRALLGPGPRRDEALARLRTARHRFNGPSDGQSAERIATRVEALIKRAA